MLSYLLNGISRGKLGTVALSVWSIGWIFLQGMEEDWIRLLNRYSPQSWNDLSNKKISSIAGIAGWLLLYIVIFWAVNGILSKKRKIEVD